MLTVLILRKYKGGTNMSTKLFGGIAIGVTLTGCAAYFLYNKKIKDIKDHEKNLEEEVSKINESLNIRTTERDTIDSNFQKLKNKYLSLDTDNNKMIKLYSYLIGAYASIIDVDMLADIANLTDIDDRDECLSKIEKAINTLKEIEDDANENLSKLNHKQLESRISTTINDMGKNIKDIIDLSEDDADDEDDDITISPIKIIMKTLDGNTKIFDADPDDGFEVLDGSNPDENDYCIIAQNVPALYKFLFASIKDQLAYHYVSVINPDVFDALLEDMVITVSLSFINETDAEVTSVNAVVPFELFTEELVDKKYKVYCVKEGELDIADAVRYFKTHNTDTDKDLGTNFTKPEQQEVTEIKKIQFDISNAGLDDNTIQFLINTIGFNRDSLKSFFGKLKILMQTNPEAGESIKTAFIDIVTSINMKLVENELDEGAIIKATTSLKALILNMKKNYGSSLKSYN